MLAPGDTFAGYTVVRELGSGGMGAVYLVQHPRLPRQDALKVLRHDLSAEGDFARRFIREADLVARMSHRNIVPVLDRGDDDGRLWLTMPFIEGQDAEAALHEAGGRLPPARAVHVVTEVASALDAAHRAGLVHRDVKPANILLRQDGDEPEQVFLTDFGIATRTEVGASRLTRTGVVIATFDYASPEQLESRPLDGRSDVYSLGCVLFKLLTGNAPFPGDTVFAALHGHLTAAPPRPTDLVPELAATMDDVVSRALAKRPEDRYPTCRALAAAAAYALLSGRITEPVRVPAPPTVIRPTSPPTTPAVPGPSSSHPPHPGAVAPGRRARRGRASWAVAAAAVGIVTVAAAVYVSQRGGDPTDAPGGPQVTTSAPSGTASAAALAALTALPRSADPLPASSVVVVRRDDTGVHLFEVDSTTGDAVQLTAGDGVSTMPFVSPDRRTVGFLEGTPDGTTQLLAMAADGGTATPLLTLPSPCDLPLRPAWDPVDPTRLALVCRAPDDRRTLRIVTLDGQVLHTLDVGDYLGDVAFSPDGSHVVFWAGGEPDSDAGSLWTVAADGSADPQQITDPGGLVDADPDWSAGGIVFRRTNDDGTRSLCLVRPDGTGLRVLTTGSHDQDPSWSPDATRIAFSSDRDDPAARSRTWTMASDGTDPRPLGDVPDGSDEPSAAAWGPR